MFHVIEIVIWFCVEIVRFTYMITFIIYHGNLWINLKLIKWIKIIKFTNKTLLPMFLSNKCLIAWIFSKWHICNKFLMQALSKYYKKNLSWF
jgi:hypothetical protein